MRSLRSEEARAAFAAIEPELLAALAGVGRALLSGNLAASVIVLTAVMPMVMVVAVMIELGRGPTADQ